MTTNMPGQLNGAVPAGVRLETLRGAPRRVGEATVTPIARRLTLRWPRGGWAYGWPSAVEIHTERGTRRARIVPVQTVALAALAGIALAALAGAAAQWRLRQRADIAGEVRGTRGATWYGNDE